MFGRQDNDSQAFLNGFTKSLVTAYDIDTLLKHSSKQLTDYFGVSFAGFLISASHRGPERYVGSAGLPVLDHEAHSQLKKLLPRRGEKLLVTAELAAEHHPLYEALQQAGMGLTSRLTSDTEQSGSGYLLLGRRRPGREFNRRDRELLEIITNQLVLAIQNALRFEEIEQFAATLQLKIDEATHKLRRTNQKLRELDEAKDDFVSMASHQLRTPLTSIKGYTSMVLEGDAGRINATQRQLLEQSFSSSQRMVYLIADLLNVSRLKTGKFIMEPVPVNLAEIVGQEIGQLQDIAAGRQLTLTYQPPDSFPSLLLDETKTRQVIMNFVDNAIYYTPAGGQIAVQLAETPAAIELRVVDNGMGVPPSDRPHLFTKFYRAGNARTARPDGTGLGLFMAKKVIAGQGGAIIFATEEGKGSTFGFRFSKSKLAPPTA